MKKSLKIVLIVIILIVIGTTTFFMINKDDKGKTVNSDSEVIFEYTSLENLISEYSLDEGVKDGCFVINNKNEIYNKDNIDKFLNAVKNDKNSNIRILQEDTMDNIYVVDLNVNLEKIEVKTKDLENQTIIENQYLKSDGYKLTTMTRILNDGSEWVGCYVINETTEDEIVLYGYITGA